jgi:hypothetical protein
VKVGAEQTQLRRGKVGTQLTDAPDATESALAAGKREFTGASATTCVRWTKVRACDPSRIKRNSGRRGEARAACQHAHVIGRTRCQFKFNSDVVRERPGWKRRPGCHCVEVAHAVSHVQATIAAAGKVSALHDAMLWNYHPPQVLQFFSSARHGRHMRGISAALQRAGAGLSKCVSRAGTYRGLLWEQGGGEGAAVSGWRTRCRCASRVVEEFTQLYKKNTVEIINDHPYPP